MDGLRKITKNKKLIPGSFKPGTHGKVKSLTAWSYLLSLCWVDREVYKIQGYSKRSINLQKFILQALLNIWRRAVYRLKGELSKLFSHLTSARCEPHVWHGRCQIEKYSSSHTRHSMSQVTAATASVMRRIRPSVSELERFPFHPYTGHGFSVSRFCKIIF
jgi:hypothetical protein